MNCPCSEEPIPMARTIEFSLRNQTKNFHIKSCQKTYIEALMINNMTTTDNPFCDFLTLFPKSKGFWTAPYCCHHQGASNRTIWDFVAKEHRSLDPNLWSYGWCSSSLIPRQISSERGAILQLYWLYRLILWVPAQQLYQCKRQDDTVTLMLVRGMVKII